MQVRYIILLGVLLMLGIYLALNGTREEKWIKRNPVCTKAFITYNLARTVRGKKKINYFYRVNGEAYYREFVPATGEKPGDSICIVYSSDHPEASRRIEEMEEICNCQ